MRFRLTFLLWFLACSLASAELVIGKPEWGFDGTALPDAFNILTVDVRNTSGQPYEGVISLDDGARFGSRDTAPYAQKVFIAPGASRSVQFYPYFVGTFSGFRITWTGREEGKMPVDTPSAGSPAVVLLADFAAPNLRSVGMRAFNEANFPPTASATEGLHAVVMDHQPRWDATRREAFLDWLKRGGLVHLINGPDGAVPQFSGELAALNDSAPRYSVGAGLVVRHQATRGEISQEFLDRAGFPKPQSSKDTSSRYDDGDNAIFRQLSTITKPKIAWGLIYTLTFLYVALVGPGFYFLRKRDHRVLIGGFVMTVTLFAWIFTVIGRRGYGEKQIYHSVGLARWIDGDKWDARHWVHAFATSGGMYRFAMPGASQLYASHSQGGNMRGEVLQGREGSFTADIPLFSSRPFFHQGVMKAPELGWAINSYELREDKSVASLSLKEPSRLRGQVLNVVAQVGQKYYRLENAGGEWRQHDGRINRSPGQSLASAFGGPENDYPYYDRYGYENANVALDQLRGSGARLARRISGNPDTARVPVARPPEAGVVRVFAYANAPQAFSMENSEFQAGHCFVLFVQDLAPSPQATP